MADILVNSKVWDAVSDAEKQQITDNLKHYGVLKAGDNVVGDANTPPPGPQTQIYGATVELR